MTIISGGQTGADQGALAAARRLGIKTGGWMPRGFLTEKGEHPALRELYDLQEHSSRLYPPRTRQNVKDADLTVWVDDGAGTLSPGFRCTRRAAQDYGKPFLVNPSPFELSAWVANFSGLFGPVINVAGPRASRDREAYRRAADLIFSAFPQGK